MKNIREYVYEHVMQNPLVKGVILLVCCALFVIFEVLVLLDESLYTTKGSVLYHMTIPPSIIRRFPEINPVERITYHYSVGDGPAPA